MRLLNAKTLAIQEFIGEEESPKFPRFAILSHTWGEEECTLQNMQHPADVAQRKGYQKIKYCCDQALQDGLEWAWVDTYVQLYSNCFQMLATPASADSPRASSCCIDKTSTAELSEAINSMFRWYRNAAVCYAYLADVENISQLADSRWLTRGWTLQELVAPKDLRFYTTDWKCLGSKVDPQLLDALSGVTRIERSVLSTGQFEDVTVAKRMSWAAGRETTRVEDSAYCLLGIFDLNMPLLYGEGKKAFRRLQEEILKVSDDHTLFAWGLDDQLISWDKFHLEFPDHRRLRPFLADSASEFTNGGKLVPLEGLQPDIPPIVTGNGLRIELPVLDRGTFTFALISCTIRGSLDMYLAIPLMRWNTRFTGRCGGPVLVSDILRATAKNHVILVRQPPITGVAGQPILEIFKIDKSIASTCEGVEVSVDEVFCLPHASQGSYSDDEAYCISLSEPHAGPHAVVFLSVEQGKMFWNNEPKDDEPKSFIDQRLRPKFMLGVIIGGVVGARSDTRPCPWADVVAVLGDGSKDKDFYMWAKQEDKRWMAQCTTKASLKERLVAQHSIWNNPSQTSESRQWSISHKLLKWQQTTYKSGNTRKDYEYYTYHTHCLVTLSINIDFKIDSVNLLEQGGRLVLQLKHEEKYLNHHRGAYSSQKGNNIRHVFDEISRCVPIRPDFGWW